MSSEAGLTPFILAMLKTEPHVVAKADPGRLAAKYGVPVGTAKGYVDLYVGRVM